MNLTPSQAFEHVKESFIRYLETQYRIAHLLVYRERAKLLREPGVVSQVPFIESTPAFPLGRKLADLEQKHPDVVPEGLAELIAHGVPVDRFPLYKHQEEALLASVGERPNLLVATGTGSGKTEAILLPILADILREARAWPSPRSEPRPGEFDPETRAWLHSRRHETKPAALRAIILYPMNALVNDQMSRLRRILARGQSPNWQRKRLRENQIYFAMYTSLSRPTGHWEDAEKRRQFTKYLQEIERQWAELPDELRSVGMWPRPDSPEMLCRWDVQHAPPDILITNYSMLEYILVRPIEAPIFDLTRRWLETGDNARLTLVIDEVHTYTGAKGTEVAYLVRRLKERLGLEHGSPKFRAIATSASVPNREGAESALRSFVADLFDEPPERFTFIGFNPPP